MASAPSKTTTVKTVNNKTGVTTSASTTVSGGKTTVTKTTTIGAAKTVTPAAKTVSAPAALARAALGSVWITGPNDTRPMCAPVAVANALMGATGVTASNAAIERLHKAAGGYGNGAVPLLPVLAAARSDGLAGCRLKTFRRAGLDDADVLLLALAGEPDLHAAAFAGMKVITWGEEIPLEELGARILGAWSLTWHGEEVTIRG